MPHMTTRQTTAPDPELIRAGRLAVGLAGLVALALAVIVGVHSVGSGPPQGGDVAETLVRHG
ncbi:hypothetical protein CU669_20555 [Paramagnetospirillum kuznetsovii]|uniref:Uncharacterized protein n=1 Tax=Paramagnetospirillum kuznetsovii TaxID=2053833 RepID=A0A364NSF5_9PROT|nr:hypothetical protein [Paramagnetospirillum kuznetsovii]RAU20021.1 hypothetical protein CU669_20555 [Paramagnetospirillum kuznetsovii]